MSKAFLYGAFGGAGGAATEKICISPEPPADKTKIWIKDDSLRDVKKIVADRPQRKIASISALQVGADKNKGCLAIVGGYLYIFTSGTVSGPGSVIKYSLSDNSSETLSCGLPFSPHYAFAYGTDIYLASGQQIARFNTLTNAVATVLTSFGAYGSLLQPCWALCGGTLYCFGGSYKNSDNYRCHSDKIFAYDISSSASLGQVGTMPFGASTLAGCACGDKIYGFGGMLSDGTTTRRLTGICDNAFVFDTLTKQSASIKSLPAKGCFGGATAFGDDKIMIVGCVMPELNRGGKDILIYDAAKNEYSFSSVSFSTIMLSDGDNFVPECPGLVYDETRFAVYSAAGQNVYKTEVCDALDYNHVYVECADDKDGREVFTADDLSVSLPISKVYVGDSNGKAVLKQAYFYDKRTDVKRNYSVVQAEIEKGTSISATAACAVGDRLLAAVCVRTTDITLPDGWTVLNVDWAQNSQKVESMTSSSPYTAQYTLFATKIAESASETFTLSQSVSGRAFLSVATLKNNFGITPSVTALEHSLFNDRTNGQNEFSVVRPSGLLIWYANCILFNVATCWNYAERNAEGYSAIGSRQALFVDGAEELAGQTVKFNTMGKKTTAAIGCVRVIGMSEFYGEEDDAARSGWKNIVTGAAYSA